MCSACLAVFISIHDPLLCTPKLNLRTRRAHTRIRKSTSPITFTSLGNVQVTLKSASFSSEVRKEGKTCVNTSGGRMSLCADCRSSPSRSVSLSRWGLPSPSLCRCFSPQSFCRRNGRGSEKGGTFRFTCERNDIWRDNIFDPGRWRARADSGIRHPSAPASNDSSVRKKAANLTSIGLDRLPDAFLQVEHDIFSIQGFDPTAYIAQRKIGVGFDHFVYKLLTSDCNRPLVSRTECGVHRISTAFQ